MSKLLFKSAGVLIVLILIVVFVRSYGCSKLKDKSDSQNKETVSVRKVFDGDTFEIDQRDENGKYYKVRMIGIDAPEEHQSDKLERKSERSGQDKQTIENLGRQASEFTKDLINGRDVILKREPNYDEKDRYGRLLRYVYLEDGTFVNLKLIQEGYANVYRNYHISKQDEFIKAEKEARENRRGLWGSVDGTKQMDDNNSK